MDALHKHIHACKDRVEDGFVSLKRPCYILNHFHGLNALLGSMKWRGTEKERERNEVWHATKTLSQIGEPGIAMRLLEGLFKQSD